MNAPTADGIAGMAAENGRRITVSAVTSLAPGEEIRDGVLKGFGVRRRRGTPTYFVQRRVNGRMARVTIGPHGSPWTAETARKEASRLILEMMNGSHPRARESAPHLANLRLAEVAQEFLEVHGTKLKPTTYETYSHLIRHQLVPKLGKLAVRDISHRDVSRAHVAWGAQPRTANHALSVLSSLMSWAEEQGYREKNANPCVGIKRFREGRRERFLSMDEVGRLGAVLRAEEEAGSTNPYVIAALRTLIYTGARVGEILPLRWDYVDLERRMLFLPDSKTGAKSIPLSDAACDVLAALPVLDDNPHVFPGHVRGKHLVNLSKPWIAIRRKAGLEDVRLHDLRHSFASAAVSMGGTLPIIGKALGHSQPQTTARYAHLSEDPVRQLVNTTSEALRQALNPPSLPSPAENVGN